MGLKKLLDKELTEALKTIEAGNEAFMKVSKGEPKKNDGKPSGNDQPKPIGTWNIPEKGETVVMKPEEKKPVNSDTEPIGKWNKH
jgi:hypothetical protein